MPPPPMASRSMHSRPTADIQMEMLTGRRLLCGQAGRHGIQEDLSLVLQPSDPGEASHMQSGLMAISSADAAAFEHSVNARAGPVLGGNPGRKALLLLLLFSSFSSLTEHSASYEALSAWIDSCNTSCAWNIVSNLLMANCLFFHGAGADVHAPPGEEEEQGQGRSMWARPSRWRGVGPWQ
jgi:hypothetical protein